MDSFSQFLHFHILIVGSEFVNMIFCALIINVRFLFIVAVYVSFILNPCVRGIGTEDGMMT